MRVVVAMSGGVDSSVAAALLRAEGHEVIGVTLNVWPKPAPSAQPEREDACCSLSAVEDARRVADSLGIPHYTLNFREVFAATVIKDFVAEYQRGRTPNPCLRCNEHVKFGALLDRAEALGADYIATGHYARIAYDGLRGRYLLRKGLDPAKDQSYVLYALRQAQLARTLLPLGEMTKAETRRLAAELRLAVADKAESQELCFVPDNDYGSFLRDQAGLAPPAGPIFDQAGRQMGTHRGLVYYTVGQRRGLGLAAGEPLYVIALDPERNALVVGPESTLYASCLVAEAVNLVAVPELPAPAMAKAKVRYRAPEAEAQVSQLPGGRLRVRFAQPQRAIAPGQAVVAYQGDEVLGGGTIAAVQRECP